MIHIENHSRYFTSFFKLSLNAGVYVNGCYAFQFGAATRLGAAVRLSTLPSRPLQLGSDGAQVTVHVRQSRCAGCPSPSQARTVSGDWGENTLRAMGRGSILLSQRGSRPWHWDRRWRQHRELTMAQASEAYRSGFSPNSSASELCHPGRLTCLSGPQFPCL